MEAFLHLLAVEKLKLPPLITHRFPIESAHSVYDLITRKNGEPFLAVLLTYPNSANATMTIELAQAPHPVNQSRLGVSVLGAGSFATSTLLPLLKDMGEVSPRGVCTASGVHARHAGERFGFQYCTTSEQQIVNDPQCDAVVIATRHHLHAAQVLAALGAGKHVFCEKPLCLSEDELSEIIRALAISGRAPLLTVGFNRRFAPLALRLKSFLSAIQEPIAVQYRINAGSLPPDHWVNDPEQGGGRILGELCHFVDFLIFLTNSLPVKIYARGLAASGVYSGDNVAVVVDFANGSQATINYLANGDRAYSKERLEVFGGGSTAVLDDFRLLALIRHGRKKVIRSRWRQDKGHRAELRAFVEAVRKGSAAPIPLEEIVATTLTTFRIQESLATGASLGVDVGAFLSSALDSDSAGSVPA